MERRESQRETMSRRRLAQLAGGAATGLMLAGAGCMTETTTATDPRIAEIERRRGRPLTEAQRKALPVQLKDLDAVCEEVRKFALSDGGSEPGTIFHPVPPGQEKLAPKETARA